jgi:hypothetical protein
VYPSTITFLGKLEVRCEIQSLSLNLLIQFRSCHHDSQLFPYILTNQDQFLHGWKDKNTFEFVLEISLPITLVIVTRNLLVIKEVNKNLLF